MFGSLVAFGVCACGATPDTGHVGGDAGASPASTAGMVQRTIVVLNADGTRTVTEDAITPEEHQAELALRTTGGVRSGEKTPEGRVTACGMADLILYNYANGGTPAQGSASCPAEICFVNNDTHVDSINLSEYSLAAPEWLTLTVDGRKEQWMECALPTTWATSVASVQSGESQDACISANDVQKTTQDWLFAGPYVNLTAGWDDENIPAGTGPLHYVYLDYSPSTRAWCNYWPRN